MKNYSHIGEVMKTAWDNFIESIGEEKTKMINETFNEEASKIVDVELLKIKNLLLGVLIGVFGGLVASAFISILVIFDVDKSWYFGIFFGGIGFIASSFYIIYSKKYKNKMRDKLIDQMNLTLLLHVIDELNKLEVDKKKNETPGNKSEPSSLPGVK